MLDELEALYDLGYRGHVDFVDDNFIGNKKLKQFLPQLKAWLEERDCPFEFSTEASINLADDDELLQLMQEANFFAIFVGIESPDGDAACRCRRSRTRALHRREHPQDLRHGMFVNAGFILGFDTEKGSWRPA